MIGALRCGCLKTKYNEEARNTHCVYCCNFHLSPTRTGCQQQMRSILYGRAERALRRTNIEPILKLIGQQKKETETLTFKNSDGLQS